MRQLAILTLYSSLLFAAWPAQAQPGTAAPQANTCPDLGPYYLQGSQQAEDWQALEQRLAPLMEACLFDDAYFALYGASLLNSGLIPEALEALERAILINPENGAAQIDYAQALYFQGQLFPAMDMNRQLLAREDLPEDLRPLLEERQAEWRRDTRESGVQADILAGYDSNLNGAPDPSQITLTLSGESVTLPLEPQFRPQRGGYTNLRLSGRYRQLGPSHDHNGVVAVRGRLSEHSESDLVQVDSRYTHNNRRRHHNWQFNAGLGHLMFGGSPLYTAFELGARYQVRRDNCRPHYELAAQHQLFHNQNIMNGVEAKLSAGLECPLGSEGRQQLVLEAGYLHNQATKPHRPGGTRAGYQLRLDWQYLLASGMLSAQLNHTRMDDRRGYSEVLENNAARHLSRSYALLQYRHPLGQRSLLLFNLFHQQQRSNLALFDNKDTTIEVGFSLGL